jgi:hypothetical protein
MINFYIFTFIKSSLLSVDDCLQEIRLILSSFFNVLNTVERDNFDALITSEIIQSLDFFSFSKIE